MGHDEVDEFDFLFGFLVAAFGFFLAGVAAFFERGHVGEDEFGVDDLDVADGIDGAEFVDDVVVFEAADDLDDGVGFADVGEELVAEAGAFGCAFDESGDVDEFDGGGDEFLGSGDFGEDGEARVRDHDDPDVGVDGAERIVRRLRFAGAGYRVEECRFSDVWQSYDSGLEHGGGRLGGIGWRAKGKKVKAEEEEGSEGLKVEGRRWEEASRWALVVHWLADEDVGVPGGATRGGLGIRRL